MYLAAQYGGAEREHQRRWASANAAVLRVTRGYSEGSTTTKDGKFIPVFGPTMARSGVGDPDWDSWSLPYSTVVLLLKLDTHTSPEGATATP
jgi:hypothetical protein